jgi:hypothetical protein
MRGALGTSVKLVQQWNKVVPHLASLLYDYMMMNKEHAQAAK